VGTRSLKTERDTVLLPSISARVAVEAGVSQGWHRCVGAGGNILSVERFCSSEAAEVLLRENGFTLDNVCARRGIVDQAIFGVGAHAREAYAQNGPAVRWIKGLDP